MKQAFAFCLVFIVGGILFPLKATLITHPQDTIIEKEGSYLRDRRKDAVMTPLTDDERREMEKDYSTTEVSVLMQRQDSTILLPKVFTPNPTKATLYALIPGGGQIYNRKYWKLPIVYGGVIGFTYAISWNGRMYNDYGRAYKEAVLGTGDSWKDFGITEEMLEAYTPQLKRQRDNFRRNRDLAMILAVAFYGLTILDAYVDAHLYNFDVSPDLSMRIEPVMYEPTPLTKRGFGLQCSFSF